MSKFYIDSMTNNDIFKYICIIVISVFIFSSTKIHFTLVIGLLFGIIICYYIYSKNLAVRDIRKKILQKNKTNSQFIKYFPEIEDFIYNISDIKYYNIDAYYNIIRNIDAFLNIYNDIKIGVKYCKYNYDVAVDMKNNALNHLHSMIITIEENRILNNKLKLSLTILHKLLNKYLNEIIRICNNNIDIDGYSINTSYINKNEFYPANKFDWRNNISFDLY